MKFKKKFISLLTLSLIALVVDGVGTFLVNVNTKSDNVLKAQNFNSLNESCFISEVTKDGFRDDIYSGDGFTYEIINNEAKLISSVYPKQNNILEIPDVISYNGKQYPVTLYANGIFDKNSGIPLAIDTIIISENTKEFSENFLIKNSHIKHVTYKDIIDLKEKMVLPKGCVNVKTDISVEYQGNTYTIYDDNENGGCKLTKWKQNNEVSIIPDYIMYNKKKIWVRVLDNNLFNNVDLTNVKKLKLPSKLEQIYDYAFDGLAKYDVIEQISYRELNNNPNDGFVLPDSVIFCQEFKPSIYHVFKKITGDVIISKNINSANNYLKYFPNARSITHNKNLGHQLDKGLSLTPARYVDNGNGTCTIFKNANNISNKDITQVSITGQNSSYNLWDNLSLDLLINNNSNFQVSPEVKFSWLRKVNNNWVEFSTSKNITNILLTPEWINSEIKVKVTQNNNIIESSPIKLTINVRDFTSISFDKNIFNINEGSNLSIEPSLTYYDNKNHDNEVIFKWEKYVNNRWEVISSEKILNLNNINLSWNNNKLRLKVSYKEQEIISNDLTIIVKEKPIISSITITSNTTSLTQGESLNLNSSIAFSDGNSYLPEVMYSWEKTSNSSDNWESIGSTNSLTINQVDLSWNNCKIRLKVTFNNKTYYSNVLNITVQENPYIEYVNIKSNNQTLHEKDQFYISSTLSFTDNIDHTNEVTYNWEMQLSNSSTWQSISSDKSYKLDSIGLNFNNAKFRLICSLNGKSMQSNILTIKVNPLPYIDSVTISFSSSNLIEGQKLEITPSLSFTDYAQYNEGIAYTWERQKLNSTNWEKISNNKILNIESLSYSWKGSKIRLRATFNEKEVISNEITLNISRIPLVTNVIISGLEDSYNINSTVSLTSNVSMSSGTNDFENIKYSWEIKKCNQNTWRKVSDTKDLSFNIPDTSYDLSQIRLSTLYNNNKFISNELTLNVVDYDNRIKNIEVTGLKDKYNIGDSINLTAKITLFDNQVNTNECGYQWQILKSNTRSNWENIGSNQPVLSISNITEEYAGCKIRLIPLYNNVQLDSKIKQVSNSIIISGINDQNQSNNIDNDLVNEVGNFFEENWPYFAIGGGVLGGLILLAILISIFIYIHNKNKREEEIKNRTIYSGNNTLPSTTRQLSSSSAPPSNSKIKK